MARFTVKPNDDVKVFVHRNLHLVAHRYDDFASVRECIAWAKSAAEKIDTIEIVNESTEQVAYYNAAGKRI